MARRLLRLSISRVDLVDRGANQKAHIVLAKRQIELAKDSPALSAVHVDSIIGDGDERDEYEKATLSSDSRNNLPDSAFAAVWTDAQGKKHRKLPIHDAGHLAAARGRVDQADIPAHVKAEAKHKIESASHAHTVAAAHANESHKEKRMTIKDLLKRAVGIVSESDAEKRTLEAAAFLKAVDTPGTPEHEAAESGVSASAHLPPEHVAAMKAHHAQLGEMIAAHGAGPHPDGHPVHALKALHEQYGKMLAAHEGPGQSVSGSTNKEASMDSEVTKRFTELEKKAKDAEDRAKAAEDVVKHERGQRLDAEMRTVLKSFKVTPFNVDEAKVDNDIRKFRDMQEKDPEGFKRTMELLKAADDRAAESALFTKSYGSSRSGGSGSDSDQAWQEIEAKADTMMEKSANSNLTREQVINKVMEQNPKLVHRYRAGQQ